MGTSIFEKILYGIKVANDNIIVINQKIDALAASLNIEDPEPTGTTGEKQQVLHKLF